MVVRLGFVPAVALSVLTSAGAASAQYYPAQPSAPQTYSAPVEDVQVPAAYDPYGAASSSAAPSSSGTPVIMAPPAPAYLSLIHI